MKCTILDTETGETAEKGGVCTYQWTDNNWSCDCNREHVFGRDTSDGVCIGCHRYLVISAEVEADLGDLDYDVELEELNSEYPEELKRKHLPAPVPAVLRGVQVYGFTDVGNFAHKALGHEDILDAIKEASALLNDQPPVPRKFYCPWCGTDKENAEDGK